MTVADARRQMLALAAMIEEITGRLDTLIVGLPASPERDAMYECQIPYDIPAELYAVAEGVRGDYLEPAARALARAAHIDQRSLDERFRELTPLPCLGLDGRSTRDRSIGVLPTPLLRDGRTVHHGGIARDRARGGAER